MDVAVSVPEIQRIELASNDPLSRARGRNTIPDLLDAEQSLEHWKLLGHRWQRHCYSLHRL
jgi:hypothetical protein